MNFINIFFQVLAILLLFGFCVEIGDRIRKKINQRNQRYDQKRLKL